MIVLSTFKKRVRHREFTCFIFIQTKMNNVSAVAFPLGVVKSNTIPNPGLV
jgi:hypothetical protein